MQIGFLFVNMRTFLVAILVVIGAILHGCGGPKRTNVATTTKSVATESGATTTTKKVIATTTAATTKAATTTTTAATTTTKEATTKEATTTTTEATTKETTTELTKLTTTTTTKSAAPCVWSDLDQTDYTMKTCTLAGWHDATRTVGAVTAVFPGTVCCKLAQKIRVDGRYNKWSNNVIDGMAEADWKNVPDALRPKAGMAIGDICPGLQDKSKYVCRPQTSFMAEEKETSSLAVLLAPFAVVAGVASLAFVVWRRQRPSLEGMYHPFIEEECA